MRGTISSVLEELKKRPAKGEITVLLGLHATADVKDAAGPSASIMSELQSVMAGQRVDEKAALKVVAGARGISKSEVYRELQVEKNRKK